MNDILRDKLALARRALQEIGYGVTEVAPHHFDLSQWAVKGAEIASIITLEGQFDGLLYAHDNNTVSVSASQRAMNAVVVRARAFGHEPKWINIREKQI